MTRQAFSIGKNAQRRKNQARQSRHCGTAGWMSLSQWQRLCVHTWQVLHRGVLLMKTSEKTASSPFLTFRTRDGKRWSIPARDSNTTPWTRILIVYTGGYLRQNYPYGNCKIIPRRTQGLSCKATPGGSEQFKL